MKSIFLLLLGVSLLSSCKKEYTCECNTTVTYYSSQDKRYYTEVIPGDKTVYDRKLSNGKAKAACEHEQTAVESNFENWLSNNGQSPAGPGESISTSCALK